MTSKYQQIAGLLRQEILDGTHPAGSLLPTELALCETFGVSRQTVRSALAELVKAGLIERTQGRGSVVLPWNTQPVRRRSIAVVTTYISNYIFPALLRDIEAELTAHNCAPMLFSTNNMLSQERQVLQDLLALPTLDGVIVEGTKTTLPNPNLALYRELQARGVPMVFMNGCYSALPEIPAILDDNAAGGQMLVEYLAKKGHQKIAGLFKSDDMQGQQRFAGYVAGLQACGLTLDDANLYWYDTKSLHHLSSPVYELAPEVLAALEGCTAAVCYNDDAALRLVHGLQASGVRIPEQMAVVSFDNSYLCDLAPRKLTSLSHGSVSTGLLAARTLWNMLDGLSGQSSAIGWTLIERESS